MTAAGGVESDALVVRMTAAVGVVSDALVSSPRVGVIEKG